MTDQDELRLSPGSAEFQDDNDAGQTSTLITARLVSAYCGTNKVATTDLPGLIQAVYAVVGSLEPIKLPPAVPAKPAVPVKQSVGQGHLICLEDGLRFKSLKRHLRTSHGLSPQGYRVKWGLAESYPMVAPDYAVFRSAQAVAHGLGRRASAKPTAAPEASAPAKAATPKARVQAALKAEPAVDTAESARAPKAALAIRYPANRYSKKAR